MKNQNGITLVSLVITIIIILILASVSISMLVSDNSILKQARNAVDSSKRSAALEVIDLILVEWEMEEINGNKTFEEFLNSKVGSGSADLDSVTVDEETSTIVLEKDGYTKVVDMIKQPNVGDYVNYTPSGVAYTTSYNVEATYSGYTSDQIVYQQETQWRILNINNGILTLIAVDNLGIGNTEGNATKLYLHGAAGYNNGIDLLNLACQNLYSNSSIGATARSIRQSDLDKYSTYDKTSYSYVGGAYGDTFSASNRFTPALFLDEKGCNGNTSGFGREDLVGLGTYTGASKQTLTVLIQEWWYRFTEYCDNDLYKELLDGNDYYWTATRNVIIDNASGTGSNIYPCYGIGKNTLVEDSYGHSTASQLLKPIVEINSASLTRDTETTINGYNCWNLQ